MAISVGRFEITGRVNLQDVFDQTLVVEMMPCLSAHSPCLALWFNQQNLILTMFQDVPSSGTRSLVLAVVIEMMLLALLNFSGR